MSANHLNAGNYVDEPLYLVFYVDSEKSGGEF